MSIQHPQLMDVEGQLRDTALQARALAERAGPKRWQTQPAPGQWAPSECVQHLIATIDAFLPLIDAVLDAAPAPPSRAVRAFKPGLFGRMLIRVIEPPYRLRTKTVARFVPPSTRPPDLDRPPLARVALRCTRQLLALHYVRHRAGA